MNDKHIIWSNNSLDYNDWIDDLEEEYPSLSESERISKMHEINNENLNDERINLNIQLSRPIIIIGDIGRWNGRRSGYKMVESGNIRDCLYSDCEYNEWFVDRLGDLRCTAVHHDGTNHYLYRVFKDTATDDQIDSLKNKIYYGKATRQDITIVTKRLGDEIAAVYGFDIPRRIEKSYER